MTNQPIVKKWLFMTATETSVIRENEEFYGEQSVDFSFKKARAAGAVTDYRVVILGVKTSEADTLIRERKLVHVKEWQKVATAPMLAGALGLRRVMKEQGAAHALSFHSSKARMARFEKLQSDISADFTDQYAALDTFAVTCDDRQSKRDSIKRAFVKSSNSLLMNVRVFVEGVDCPDIDMVAFIDPKQSWKDIQQGVGRAIRTSRANPDKVATIFIPVLVNEDGTYEDKSFQTMQTILGALKEKDEGLVEALKVRAEMPEGTGAARSDKVVVLGPVDIDAKEFDAALRTAIVDGLQGTRLSLADYVAEAKKRGFFFFGAVEPTKAQVEQAKKLLKKGIHCFEDAAA